MLWLGMQGPRDASGWSNVLRLDVSGDGEKLRWRQGSDFPEIPPVITHRSTFSMCGKLLGHFPECSWLRVAAAAIKHHMTSVWSGWDEKVPDIILRCMIIETMKRVMQNNPVR